MSAASFVSRRDVSRETMSRLEVYADLLIRWNARINLVGPATIAELWTRHILDSAQIFDFARPERGLWADLGTGAGLPGLIVAILAAEEAPDLKITLVESDARKAAFLLTAARECGVKVQILTERIESLPPLGAQFLSARALAPLDQLLGYAMRHLAPGGTAFFSKGASYRDELSQALERWRFTVQTRPSITSADAVVLVIRDISRV